VWLLLLFDVKPAITIAMLAHHRTVRVIHSIAVPSLFIAGLLFVSTGLAYDLFGIRRQLSIFHGKPTRNSINNPQF
jgi:cytochrome b559 alpha subunit